MILINGLWSDQLLQPSADMKNGWRGMKTYVWFVKSSRVKKKEARNVSCEACKFTRTHKRHQKEENETLSMSFRAFCYVCSSREEKNWQQNRKQKEATRVFTDRQQKQNVSPSERSSESEAGSRQEIVAVFIVVFSLYDYQTTQQSMEWKNLNLQL